MKKLSIILLSISIFIGITIMSCATTSKQSSESGSLVGTIESLTQTTTKDVTNNNPLLPNFFCADPTAVEYNGRLYVYGTNDHEMYRKMSDEERDAPDSKYGYIKTLVMMSSADMANWTFHGEIPVTQIVKGAGNSWAPSIVSREEEDGLTHFYMYFANGGSGIGVMTSTSPVGPWTASPKLGSRLLIKHGMPTLGRCDWLFDPGVVIDDNGDGWIAFGGSGQEESKKIAKLGKDMVSLASDIITVKKAVDHFEANELNYINGTYIWSYCTKWGNLEKTSVAAMAYVTSKTPLDAESWEFQGEYFKNQVSFGLGGGNNHTHLHKFKGNYYLIYQAHDLHDKMGIKADCRNINIDLAEVDEENAKIKNIRGTKAGVPQIENPPSNVETPFSMMATGADFEYNKTDTVGFTTISATTNDGVAAWTLVKGVQFDGDAKSVTVNAKGKGVLKVSFDTRELNKATEIKINSEDFSSIETPISIPAGVHNIYFMFSNKIELSTWKFN